MKNYFYFTFILLFVFSCKTEKEDTKDTLCENQKFLLAPNDSYNTFTKKNVYIPKKEHKTLDLDLDLNLNTQVNLKILKDTFNIEDLCNAPIAFNKKIKDRIVRLNIEALCNFIGQRNSELIEINYNNLILIDNYELKKLDSISFYVEKNFPFFYNNKNKIDLTWEYGVSHPIIDDVIYEISDGYLNAIDKIVERKFKKSTCELSEYEIKEIQKEFPITIFLNNYSQFLEQEFIAKQWYEKEYSEDEESQLPE